MTDEGICDDDSLFWVFQRSMAYQAGLLYVICYIYQMCSILKKFNLLTFPTRDTSAIDY